MDKVEVIARRILGWKLNRWDRWFDHERDVFIYDFKPADNLEHAMMIVERMEQYGYAYQTSGEYTVCFNEVCQSGGTLAEAITNAAYEIAENISIDEEWL